MFDKSTDSGNHAHDVMVAQLVFLSRDFPSNFNGNGRQN